MINHHYHHAPLQCTHTFTNYMRVWVTLPGAIPETTEPMAGQALGVIQYSTRCRQGSSSPSCPCLFHLCTALTITEALSSGTQGSLGNFLTLPLELPRAQWRCLGIPARQIFECLCPPTLLLKLNPFRSNPQFLKSPNNVHARLPVSISSPCAPC